MASLLQPSYTLTLGSQQWTNQALAIEVELGAAPLVDTVAIRFPAGAPLSSAEGDPAVLSLGNGEATADVFTGTIDSVQRSAREIRVTALNGGGILARFRPATTYEQITAGNLVRSLCDDAGVETGDIDDGVALTFYAADPGRSALNHIERVCSWGGSMVRFSSDNKLEAPVINATVAESALRYGREILSIENVRQPAHTRQFTVAGESGVGDTAAPEAFRMTTDFFAGNAPDPPSIERRWRSEPALRTAQTAARAGAATERIYNSSRERGRFHAFLLPALRPGGVLEIQDLPDGLQKGPIWLYRIRHRVRHDGAVTTAYFCKGGESFDSSALLGASGGA